jgi:hypothetical protein
MHQPLYLSLSQKIAITSAFALLSIIGLMLKLPVIFRSIDKEMHFLFYFFSAAFLNFLFVNGKVIKHLVILILLGGFGYLIEIFQEFSNKFFKKRIHGNFDIQDIEYNLKGLLLFSMLWFFYYIIVRILKIFSCQNENKNIYTN